MRYIVDLIVLVQLLNKIKTKDIARIDRKGELEAIGSFWLSDLGIYIETSYRVARNSVEK